jgi:hypothetical protein
MGTIAIPDGVTVRHHGQLLLFTNQGGAVVRSTDVGSATVDLQPGQVVLRWP